MASTLPSRSVNRRSDDDVASRRSSWARPSATHTVARPGHDARTGHAIDDLAKVDTFRFVNRTGRAELPDVVTDP